MFNDVEPMFWVYHKALLLKLDAGVGRNGSRQVTKDSAPHCSVSTEVEPACQYIHHRPSLGTVFKGCVVVKASRATTMRWK